MKRTFRTLRLFVGPLLILSACAGSLLHVPGDLARPTSDVAPVAGATQAVVMDFSYAAAPDGVLGRDYDRVRSIVWAGRPGKAMADLVAGALRESRVAAVRGGTGGDGVPVRITGVVHRFEVNTRRAGGAKVTTEATVSVTVTAEGPGLSGPSVHTVTSSASLDDIFVTSDGLREALMSAANNVAGEAVRKLLEAKVVSPSS